MLPTRWTGKKLTYPLAPFRRSREVFGLTVEVRRQRRAEPFVGGLRLCGSPVRKGQKDRRGPHDPSRFEAREFPEVGE